MIPIDEQIAGLKIARSSCVAHGLNPCQIDAILASLQRLKAIDAVQVPEEPKYVEAMRSLGKTDPAGYGDLVDSIDTLRDLLKRESARADKWEAEADKQFQYAGRVLEQANAAEAKLAEKERENEALRKDAERVLIATAHYHVQSHDGNDTCKECGLNLRDKIHFPKYIDLRRAAIKEQSHE